jgi:hypothetical protein
VNDIEQKLFLKELLVAFPAFDDAARNSPDLAATHRSWAQAWSDLKLEDCRQALRGLIREGGISYEDYRSPGSFVRRLVNRSRSESDKVAGEREATRYERQRRRSSYAGSPMADALIKARLCNTSEDAYRVIESAFANRPEYDQPRHRCPVCCDRGLVLVWRADFVAMVRDGKKKMDELSRTHTYLVSCFCDGGQATNDGKHRKLPVFSTSVYCRFSDLEIDEEINKLSGWIAQQSKGVEWTP